MAKTLINIEKDIRHIVISQLHEFEIVSRPHMMNCFDNLNAFIYKEKARASVNTLTFSLYYSSLFSPAYSFFIR